LAILTVDILIIVVVALSIIPLATGQVQVNIIDDQAEPTVEGDQISLALPVEIHNGGYFDIDDLTLIVRVSEGGELIAERTTNGTDITAGHTKRLDLDIGMTLDDIPASKLMSLVFSHTTLDVDVKVKAGYTMGLVNAQVRGHQEMEWDPLISDLSVASDAVRFITNGTNTNVAVPFSFTSSNMVRGQVFGLHAQLANSTAILGDMNRTVTMQDNNQGEIIFVLPQSTAAWLATHPESLDLSIDATFRGATLHLDRTIPREAMP
jgi:hypothetical protein